MSNKNELKFDIDAQLKQIETFTRQQQLDIQEMITSSHEKLSAVEIDNAVEKVEQEVSSLLGSLEEQLGKEMEKINQQLQTLLPTEKH